MKFIILLTILISSCNQTPNKPASFTGKWNNSTWDKILVDKMKEHGFDKIIPKDHAAFNFSGDVLTSWGNIFVAMAYKESGWNPLTKYKENFKDQYGRYIISTGMWQLSQESGLGYKCDFAMKSKITNVKTNADCAMRIMKKWVLRDGVITGRKFGGWIGSARYWSVLRKDSTLKYIRGANK